MAINLHDTISKIVEQKCSSGKEISSWMIGNSFQGNNSTRPACKILLRSSLFQLGRTYILVSTIFRQTAPAEQFISAKGIRAYIYLLYTAKRNPDINQYLLKSKMQDSFPLHSLTLHCPGFCRHIIY